MVFLIICDLTISDVNLPPNGNHELSDESPIANEFKNMTGDTNNGNADSSGKKATRTLNEVAALVTMEYVPRIVWIKIEKKDLKDKST